VQFLCEKKERKKENIQIAAAERSSIEQLPLSYYSKIISPNVKTSTIFYLFNNNQNIYLPKGVVSKKVIM
jgi:hypothetical protein